MDLNIKYETFYKQYGIFYTKKKEFILKCGIRWYIMSNIKLYELIQKHRNIDKEVFELENIMNIGTLVPRYMNQQGRKVANKREQFHRLIEVIDTDEKIKKMISDNIEKNRSIRFGKPIIKGTRITVEEVIGLLADNYSIDEILKQYTTLQNTEQVRAALLYYFNTNMRRNLRYRLSLWTAQ